MTERRSPPNLGYLHAKVSPPVAPTPMPDSDSDPIAAWRDAYQRLWHDLEDEGRSPRYVLSAWGDVKPSTAAAYKRGECTPPIGRVIRLARNAAEEGYMHLATLCVDEAHRIAEVTEEVPVTGTITDNNRDLDRLQTELWNAYEKGDRSRVIEIGKEVKKEGDEIVQEGKRMNNIRS